MCVCKEMKEMKMKKRNERKRKNEERPFHKS